MIASAHELRERLETHRALKEASSGFHLSDEDIDLIIEALREMEKEHGT